MILGARVVCDWCKARGPLSENLMDTVEHTLEAGWQVSDPDLCPACLAEHQKEARKRFEESMARVRQQYPHIIKGLGDHIEGT